MRLSKLFFLSIICLIVSNCTRLETLRAVKPKGDEFQKRLVQYYKEFAEKEAEQYDWIDSQHFINKAMHAAYGMDPKPEEPSEWRISKDVLPSMEQARRELVEAINKYKSHQPEIAAKAQFYFDCWVEEQEENWQVDDIKLCRDDFYTTLNHLNEEGQRHAKQHKESHEPIIQARYRIFFDTKSQAVNEEGKKVIARIVQDMRLCAGCDIILNGYTKSVGTEEENLKLSKERAIAVKKLLLKSDLEESKLQVFAFGDANPDTEMENELVDSKNRRVEIFIGDK